MASSTTVFTNCRLCVNGTLTSKGSALIVSNATGKIEKVFHPEDGVDLDGEIRHGAQVVDLDNAVVAPGLLELQTNGMRGFHFTHFHDDESYASKINEVSRYLPSQGVTGFWATIPTVASEEFKKPSTPPSKVYGEVSKNNDTLKLVTVAPELHDSSTLISSLTTKNIRVSLGHSSASYSDGLTAIKAGATCLTHTLNAMAPLHHRDPGLAGLVTAATPNNPYFSIIPDGNHLHPSVATMLFRSNPSKCILITDSIELAGLEDGTHPGHSQIPFNQTKKGSKVVIEGTDTMVGGCASLVECVRNLRRWSGCGIAEAVRCVTGNVVDFMGDETRGKLEVGRRADLVVLDDTGEVLETWVGGRRVWVRS